MFGFTSQDGHHRGDTNFIASKTWSMARRSTLLAVTAELDHSCLILEFRLLNISLVVGGSFRRSQPSEAFPHCDACTMSNPPPCLAPLSSTDPSTNIGLERRAFPRFGRQ